MMVGRPKKDFKFKRNGSSLQFFEHGEYVGSLPLSWLVQAAKARNKLDQEEI